MEKYGFIYLWFDRKHKKFYLGRHWGTIDDGYICSSKSMREAYRRRPSDFKRRIVTRVNDRDILVLEEQRWLNMIDIEKLKTRYYNKTLKATTPSTRGYQHTSETRLKISESQKGKKLTEEHKKKISESVSNIMTVDQRMFLSKKVKGFKHTDEAKKKISEAGLGRKFSEETRLKISEAKKGKPCKPVSEETRLKLRLAALGKKRGPYKKKVEIYNE